MLCQCRGEQPADTRGAAPLHGWMPGQLRKEDAICRPVSSAFDVPISLLISPTALLSLTLLYCRALLLALISFLPSLQTNRLLLLCSTAISLDHRFTFVRLGSEQVGLDQIDPLGYVDSLFHERY